MICFDLTSSACWGGNPVGIIRVERGLFGALRDALPGRVVPVIYHRRLKLYFEVRRDVLDLIEASRATLDMSVQVSPELEQLLERPPASLGDWAYLFERSSEEADRLAAAARANLQEDWRRNVIVTDKGERKFWIPFFSAVERVVRPFVGDTVISAGLDWDDKDIVALKALKEMRGYTHVQCIYDLVPARMPQFVVPEVRVRITRFFHEVAALGDAFICISRKTEEDWHAWRRSCGAEPGRTVVFPLSSHIESSASSRLPDDVVPALKGRQFALYVSTIEPRKNHRTVYLAWKRAIQEGRIDPTRHAMLWVGMPGWVSGDLVKEVKADRSLAGSIVIAAGISDADLVLLVQQSVLSLFPSFYEGFGLGLAEALTLGKFGLASTEGSLPEVGGDFVDYLDPDDVLGWSRAIAHYMTDADSRKRREAATAAYRGARWKDAAEALLQAGLVQ